MTSPYITASAASTRSERDVKQERYIAQHIAGLRELGFGQEFLAREESMLRSGLANNNALEDMVTRIFGGVE